MREISGETLGERCVGRALAFTLLLLWFLFLLFLIFCAVAATAFMGNVLALQSFSQPSSPASSPTLRVRSFVHFKRRKGSRVRCVQSFSQKRDELIYNLLNKRLSASFAESPPTAAANWVKLHERTFLETTHRLGGL